MKKKLTILITSILLGSMFSGCAATNTKEVAAASSTNTSSSNSQSNGPAEITLWHAMGGTNGGVLQEIVDSFNQTIGKEKSITINSVYQGNYNDTDTKLRAVIQAKGVKNMPDLVQESSTGVFTIQEYKDTLWMADLQKKYPDFDLSNLEPNVLAASSFKGRQLGMPFSNSTMILYYNKDHYKQVGLDPEKPPVTMDEWADHIKKLTIKQGNNVTRYGFVHQLVIYATSNLVGMENGGSHVVNNENGRAGSATKIVFGEDGTLKEVLLGWKKMYDTGGLDHTGTDANNRFAAGETSMFLGSTASLPSTLAKVGNKFQVGTAFLPKVHANDNGGVAVGGSALYALNKNDAGKERAIVEFLKYMSSPEVQFKWNVGTGYFPVNKKTYDLPEMKAHLEKNPLYKTAIEQLHMSSPKVQEPWMPSSQEFESFLTDTVMSYLEGDTKVDEAVTEIVSKGNKLIDNYNKSNGKK